MSFVWLSLKLMWCQTELELWRRTKKDIDALVNTLGSESRWKMKLQTSNVQFQLGWKFFFATICIKSFGGLINGEFHEWLMRAYIVNAIHEYRIIDPEKPMFQTSVHFHEHLMFNSTNNSSLPTPKMIIYSYYTIAYIDTRKGTRFVWTYFKRLHCEYITTQTKLKHNVKFKEVP